MIKKSYKNKIYNLEKNEISLYLEKLLIKNIISEERNLSIKNDEDFKIFKRSDISLDDLANSIRKHKLTFLFSKSTYIKEYWGELYDLIKPFNKIENIKTFRCAILTSQLAKLFDDNEIKYLIIKGIPLALQTTGSFSGRGSSADIDLFVHPKSISKSVELLESFGFYLRDGLQLQLNDSILGKYSRFVTPEIVLCRKNKNDQDLIDLHWHISWLNLSSPSFEEVYAKREIFELYGVNIKTLSQEDAFKHSCFHAAHDSWMCIRSLIDIERLSRDFTTEKINRLREIKIIKWSTYIAYNSTKSNHLSKFQKKRFSEQERILKEAINQQLVVSRFITNSNWSPKNSLKNILRSFKLRSDPLDFIAYFLYLLISPKDIYDSQSGFTRNPLNIIFYRIKRYLNKLREFNRNKNK
mgnify:CR=1 FL=1|tara:strand:+ start:8779 stop:10011 length:1233 start_codon:yes stop_codon:yes gene_type:complete